MKGGTVQINWHDTKPVLTLDFHPISGLLATGGADFDIKIWQIDSGEAQKKIPTASYQACLSYHSSAVNVLRFSPSGEMLASGADGGELILWKSHLTDAGQTWKVHKTLSFHRKDVLDMEWSGDGAYIISGSVDNSCIIWDAIKGCAHQILDSHLHYVQGVAWDPLSKYVASISSDRSCRIYVNKTQKVKGVEKMNYVCQHVILKTEQQTTDDTKSSKNHLFHDETLPSFFRRLAWSPDGSFLLVPAGSFKNSPASEFVNTAYVFSRKDLSRPALQLPGASKPVVAVRFCPLTFSLRGTNSSGFFKLPYRLIFAVVTLNSLYIYDTECVAPLAVLAGLHYAAITDVAWSPNGKYLALSSQDGYCTLVEFHDDELGSPVTLSGGKIINSDISKDANEDKPVEMVVEASIKDSPVVEKTQINDEQTKPAASTPPVSTKLAKRRVTPMEIINSDVSKDANEDKPVEMVVEASINESPVVEKIQTDDKQTKPAASTPPVSTKPAKRRITPMAIDP